MIGRKTILAFSINMLKNVIGYAGLFFIARLMGAEAFGSLSYGFAYVGIFHFIADMGFGVAHIKKMSEGKDLPTCLGTYLFVRSLMTFLMAMAVLVSLLLHRVLYGKPLESSVHEGVILMAVFTFVLIDLAQIPAGTFAARTETARQMVPDLLGKILETLLKATVAVLGLGVVMLAGASLAGALAALILYAFLFKGYSIGRPSRSMAREYIVFALPIMVIVSANAITEHLDQIMIQAFWKSEELGYYAGAAKITTLLMFAGTAVGTLIFPAISALHSANDIPAVRRLTHRAERYTALILFPAGMLLIYNRQTLVGLLLGSGFQGSNAVLPYLALASIVSVISVPYFTQIIGVSRVRMSAMLSVVLMVLNVSFNLVFIPAQWGGVQLMGMGGRGAALATLLAAGVMGLLYRVIAFRVTGTRLNPSLLKCILASVVMYAGMLGMSRLLGRTIWADIGTSLAGSSLYVLSLMALQERLREDCSYLLSVFSPWRMGLYIRGELRPVPMPEEEKA
jgi:O-antigen/teichoic acid export membrane protein